MLASLTRIGAVSFKEVIQLSRDRVTFGMVVMFPLMELLLFGYGINTDVRHVPTAVVDASPSAFTRQLVQDLQATQVIDVVAAADTPMELERMITRGEVEVGIIVPVDAEQRHYSGQREIAQVLVDGSNTMTAMALSQLRQFPFRPGEPIANNEFSGSLSVRLLYNPERRAALFTVPGLVGIMLTLTMGLFTSIAIVREREAGNLELLIATPINNTELMLGKIIPYIFIGLIQVMIILLLGNLLFQVPYGDHFNVLVASLLFIIANLSLGLMISTLAPNQLGAMQIFMMIMLPTILLSGFMFPFEAMPEVIQTIAEFLPATHFMRVIRGLVLRGATLADVAGELWVLAGFSLVMMTIAIRLFHRRLD